VSEGAGKRGGAGGNDGNVRNGKGSGFLCKKRGSRAIKPDSLSKAIASLQMCTRLFPLIGILSCFVFVFFIRWKTFSRRHKKEMRIPPSQIPCFTIPDCQTFPCGPNVDCSRSTLPSRIHRAAQADSSCHRFHLWHAQIHTWRIPGSPRCTGRSRRPWQC